MFRIGWQKKQFKNPGRALEVGANFNTEFASRNGKSALSSLPEVINLYHTREGLHIGKNVQVFT